MALLTLPLVTLFGCSPSIAPTAPTVHVHKTANCGCCGGWLGELQAAGFNVEVEQGYDIAPRARELGVPEQFQSCLTADVEGFFIQGEVPVADIKRALSETGGAAGIAVRGRARVVGAGSDNQPGDTLLFQRDGQISVFAHHH